MSNIMRFNIQKKKAERKKEEIIDDMDRVNGVHCIYKIKIMFMYV